MQQNQTGGKTTISFTKNNLRNSLWHEIFNERSFKVTLKALKSYIKIIKYKIIYKKLYLLLNSF